MNPKKFAHKKDSIIIASFLAVALALFLFVQWRKNDDSVLEVRIMQQGKVLYHAPLTEDFVFVHPQNKALVITIQAGKAFFISSNCPDQVCVRAGELFQASESAACLPNRVIIHIIGSSSGEPSLDATAR